MRRLPWAIWLVTVAVFAAIVPSALDDGLGSRSFSSSSGVMLRKWSVARLRAMEAIQPGKAAGSRNDFNLLSAVKNTS